MTTDDVMQLMRGKIMGGELSERDIARFVEMVNEALADTLINCAAEYSLAIAIADAYRVVSHQGTKH